MILDLNKTYNNVNLIQFAIHIDNDDIFQECVKQYAEKELISFVLIDGMSLIEYTLHYEKYRYCCILLKITTKYCIKKYDNINNLVPFLLYVNSIKGKDSIDNYIDFIKTVSMHKSLSSLELFIKLLFNHSSLFEHYPLLIDRNWLLTIHPAIDTMYLAIHSDNIDNIKYMLTHLTDTYPADDTYNPYTELIRAGNTIDTLDMFKDRGIAINNDNDSATYNPFIEALKKNPSLYVDWLITNNAHIRWNSTSEMRLLCNYIFSNVSNTSEYCIQLFDLFLQSAEVDTIYNIFINIPINTFETYFANDLLWDHMLNHPRLDKNQFLSSLIQRFKNADMFSHKQFNLLYKYYPQYMHSNEFRINIQKFFKNYPKRIDLYNLYLLHINKNYYNILMHLIEKGDHDECTICKEKLVLKEYNICMLQNCFHIYHIHCIVELIKINGDECHSFNCPICRAINKIYTGYIN